MTSQDENVVIITGIPFNLTLARLKLVLYSYDVTPLCMRFEQERSDDDSTSSKSVIASMSSAKDVLVLLKKGTLNCTVGGREHFIKVDLFPKESGEKEKNDNEKTSEKSSKTYSEKDPEQEKNSKKGNQSGSWQCVHCMRLTEEYLNGTKLKDKFSIFGQINQVLVNMEKKFAVVKFTKASDALSALKTGVTIDVGNNTRILSLSLTLDLPLKEYNNIEKQVRSQQRSIFCTRIPPLSFNRDAMNKTFFDFGPIIKIELHQSQRQPYALVEFQNPQSARKVMSCSEIFTPFGTVVVDWNNRETNDIRKSILNERRQKIRQSGTGRTYRGRNDRPSTSNNQNRRGRRGNRSKPTSRASSTTSTASEPPIQGLRRDNRGRPMSPSPPPTPGNTSESQTHILKEIYCRNIPEAYYNPHLLLAQFQRFGQVEKLFLSQNDSKYAIVTFCEQSVAETLIRKGLILPGAEKPLVLRWSNKAYTKPSSSTKSASGYGNDRQPSHMSSMNGSDRTILVSRLGPKIKTEKLQHYFQNNRRSGGGKILSMQELPDGLLIVFEDSAVQRSVLEMERHEVDRKELRVFAKTDPKQLEDRFLIMGLADNPDMTILEMFLENCDRHQNAPKSYEKIGRSQLLVIYDFKICGNVDRIRAQVDGKTLENQKLLTRPIFQTDCLKVVDLKEETSDNFIELFFSNVQRSGGKDVTFVDRRVSGTQAFVFFADCNVVDRIVARSLLDKLEVDGQKVQVSHCYNYLQIISQLNNPPPFVPVSPTSSPPPTREEIPKLMTINLGQKYRVITTSKLFEVLKTKFILKFVTLESEQSVMLEGDIKEMELCVLRVHQLSDEIVSVVFGTTMSDIKKNFVRFCLEHPSRAENFREKCQAAFNAKSITASVELSDTKEMLLLFHSTGVTGAKQIESVITGLIYLRSFSCEMKHVKQAGKKWSEAVFKLFQEGILVISKQGTTTLLSLNDLTSAQEKLRKCLKEFTATKKEIIQSSELERVLFTIKYFNSSTCKLQQCGNDLQIEGNQYDLDVAKPAVLRFIESLKVQTMNIKEAHLHKILQSSEGVDFLKKSQNKHKTVILKCTADGKKVPIDQKKKATTKKKAPSVPSQQQAKIPHLVVYEGKLKTNINVSVKVIEGNIATFPCDAIVNPSNKDLKLDESGGHISARILKNGGSSIQDEMNRLLRTIGGAMFQGDAVVSGSGNLPCRKVIHTYGPSWKTQTTVNSTKYLKSCVVMCLKRAEEFKLTSIAIPLISCDGVSGGDVRVCSQLTMETISEHFAETKTSTLNQVNLVPALKSMEQLTDIVRSFSNQTVFSCYGSIPPKLPQPATSTKTWSIFGIFVERLQSQWANLASQLQRNVRQIPTKFEIGANKLSVEILVGDITAQKCDVIITSTINFEGAIINAIAQKVDVGFKKELSDSLLRMRTPNVKIATTDPYSLPCKHLLHLNIAAKISEDVVTVKEALLRANFFGAKSIAIPAFGGSRLTGKQCAELTTESIKSFLKVISQPSIGKIYVVLFNANFVDDYKSAFASFTVAESCDSTSSTPVDDSQTASSTNSKPSPGETIEKLIFCGRESAHNHSAIKELVEYKTSLVTSKRIENDLLMNKEETEKLLKLVEANHDVEIKLNVNKYVGQAVITGLRADVDAAYEVVFSTLHHLDKELTNMKFVQWKYCDICGNDVAFPLKSNYLLETNFQEIPSGTMQLLLALKDNQLAALQTVDFSNMILKSSGITLPIFRELVGSPRDVITLPREWDDMKGSDVKQVQLQPLSVEYTQTLSMFNACGLPGGSTIYKISRLQNSTLYKQFHVQRSKVERKLKGSPNIKITRRLFHGTCVDSVDSILTNGFDRSHAGNGNYGRGVYFATKSSYSHGYSIPATNGHRYMFLVDVVTGEYWQGRRDTTAIPIKAGTNEAYDCVVDVMEAPNIFVVFKDSSAYALYLLEYS